MAKKNDIKNDAYSLYGHYSSRQGINPYEGTSFGQRMAEKVANVVGSWSFIIGQSIMLIIWAIINAIFVSISWDPYPYIAMNLLLSIQAAFTAPMILMSQNRQGAKDRHILYDGWQIDRSMNQTVNNMEIDFDKKFIKVNDKLDKMYKMIEELKTCDSKEEEEEEGKKWQIN